MKKRNNNIDLLKGIAIIAVVLYHVGFLESGYLGVDIFLVIAGFLTVPSVYHRIENSDFSFWNFIKGKVIRLLPLILIASGLCLLIGYTFWLPDDYENLSESIIASTFFSNNILSAITTKNYWDTVNDYKPLMHMWYLGILMEFYVIVPLILIIVKKIANKSKKGARTIDVCVLSVLSVISLLLFLSPFFKKGDKFYYIPFRFFELAVGGILGLLSEKIQKKKWKAKAFCAGTSLLMLVFVLCVGVLTLDISKIGVESYIIGGKEADEGLLLSNSVLVVLTVLLTSLFIFLSDDSINTSDKNILCVLGRRSYSIFVWHQVLLALYRYSISTEITAKYIIFVLAVIILSELSYRLVESKIKVSSRTLAVTIVFAVIICAASGLIYINAGVVRDIPELNVSKGDVHRNMHAAYNDRVNSYDKDFEKNDKKKVLVVGNSFARDFCNIILESEYDVDLSYRFDWTSKSLADRVKDADVVFMFCDKSEVRSFVWENCDNVYGIGSKSFGHNNGNVYARRFTDDYFSQTASLDEGYRELNEAWKKDWGDHYVDMIAPVTNEDGTIRVFTDDKKLISQDCRHLTQAGARYYAKILDLQRYLG